MGPLWNRRRFVAGLPVLVAFGCAGGKLSVEQPGATIESAVGRLRKGLRKHVGDKARRKAALARVDELVDVLVGFDDIAWEWRSSMRRALEAGAGEAELQAINASVNTEVREQLGRAAQLGVAMREHLDAEEWSRVFPAPKPATKERVS